MGFFRQIVLVLVNILFWVFFVLTSTILVVGAVIIRLVTYPFDHRLTFLQQYACFWGSLYLWFNPFWSLQKSGLENVDRKKAYVIVANHQSMSDILVLFNSWLHFKWVAKKTLFYFPLLGWNMMLNRYISVDRSDPNSRQKCIEDCEGHLKEGSSILFFPEGTRSKDGKLLPFKPGAFKLALETGHDILPVVIRGTLNAIPKHSILLHGKSKMTLQILPPVSIQPYLQMEGSKALENLMRDISSKFDEK